MTTELRVSNAILKELMKIDPQFPLQWARCFHEVALEEGISINDVVKRTGIASATVSRIAAGLSTGKRYDKAPYDLIKLSPSPTDNREKELYLTTKGRALVDGLVGIIERAADGSQKARK